MNEDARLSPATKSLMEKAAAPRRTANSSYTTFLIAAFIAAVATLIVATSYDGSPVQPIIGWIWVVAFVSFATAIIALVVYGVANKRQHDIEQRVNDAMS